jgi:hypothetical protein
LAKIYNNKLKSETTNEVNKDAIIRIQQGVSPKIFHKTPTPKGKGLTPGIGGGVSDQPTALYNPWLKKVSKIKSEFRQFLNVEEVDPFKLKVSNYSGKDDPDKKKLVNEAVKTKEIERMTVLGTNKSKTKFGSKFIKTMYNINMIRIFYNGSFYGPLFRVDKKDADTLKVLKYIGSLNVDTIVDDITKGDLEPNLSKYQTVWTTGSDKGSPIPFIQTLITSNITKGGKDLIGVYFIFENTINPTSTGDLKKNRPIVLFLYATGKVHTSLSSVNSSAEIWSVSSNGSSIGKVTDISKLSSVPSVEKIEIGDSFDITNSDFIKSGSFNTIINNFRYSLFDINGVGWK